jgi:hypothetical protein
MMENIENKALPIQEEALFIHHCCSSGYKFFRRWKAENPDVKVKAVNYLNVAQEKLDVQYGFKLEDLRKNSYIIHKGQVISEPN